MSGGFIADRRQVVALGAAALALPIFKAAHAAAPEATTRIGPGRHQPFDAGWRFLRGEGRYEAPTLDDAGWREVDLPHDWTVEDLPGAVTPGRFGPFDRGSPGQTETGFTVGGEGWYRKRLDTSDLPAGARVEICFGGVAVASQVWVNGQSVGSHDYAYTPFALDLTPFLVPGTGNIIAVRVRNMGRNSRWHAGAGIYRSVTIDVTPPDARLVRWGVAASTRSIDGQRATVAVSTAVEGVLADLSVRSVLRDAGGLVVAQSTVPAAFDTQQTLVVEHAHLWSPASPALYTLETVLLRGGQPIDRTVEDFGIRIVTIDPEQGLRINGQRTILRGGCVHHDNGLLGAVALADADDRRVLLLKNRGFNALRSSHNPSSPSFRRACDRHGMLLIEEAFDTWHKHKRPDDHATFFKDSWRADLAAMVLPARNHACVIMWSIGNEVAERSSTEGLEWSWKLSNEVRRLDPTRPVTAALQEFLGRPMMAAQGTARAGHAGELDQPSSIFLDVAGYNYKLGDIEADHAAYPRRIIYASESYPHDAWDYAQIAMRAPYMLGEFVWSAMDYIGEAGVGLTQRVSKSAPPYNLITFPVYNAFCGDIDLIGGQKPQSRYRDVVWGMSPIEMLVQRPVPDGQVERIPLWGWSDELESWTWAGAEGKPIAVRLYTSGDRVELRLNGRSVGGKSLSSADRMKVELSVPFESGTLEAIAWRGGREIGRKRIETTGPAASLTLRAAPVRSRGREALCFIDVATLDPAGRAIPDAEIAVKLLINGPARLVGFGNAGPRAIGSLQAPETRLWQGRALAVLRGTGAGGLVRVEAQSDGLRGAATTVRLR